MQTQSVRFGARLSTMRAFVSHWMQSAPDRFVKSTWQRIFTRKGSKLSSPSFWLIVGRSRDWWRWRSRATRTEIFIAIASLTTNYTKRRTHELYVHTSLIWLPKWMLGVGLKVHKRNVWRVICYLITKQFTKMCPSWFLACELRIC
jgi:hypothetical protein